MAAAGETRSVPNTDVDELGKRVRLPVRPTAAMWEATLLGDADPAVPGPTDTAPTAVLTFRDEDVAKLLAEAGRQPRPGYAATVTPRDWFPAQVRRALGGEEASDGSYRLRDVYDARPFGLPPFNHGFIGRIGETSQFLLYLQTM
jgi:hypothetical protein